MDTIIAGIVTRLAGLRPRIVAQPTDSNVITLGEAGVHLFVGSPEPEDRSGAGRWGYKVTRPVGAIVVTGPTMRDPGGRDDAAVKAHLVRELEVVDAVLDFKNAPTNAGAIMVRWTPGGSEVTRWLKLNPGLLATTLIFTVTYAPSLTT